MQANLIRTYNFFICILLLPYSFVVSAQSSVDFQKEGQLINLTIDALLKRYKKELSKPITIQRETEKIFSCDSFSLRITSNHFKKKTGFSLSLDTLKFFCEAQKEFSISSGNNLVELVEKSTMYSLQYGYIVSNPLFVVGDKYAIVEVKRVCKPLCEYNEIYIFERQGNAWILMFTKVLYSS